MLLDEDGQAVSELNLLSDVTPYDDREREKYKQYFAVDVRGFMNSFEANEDLVGARFSVTETYFTTEGDQFSVTNYSSIGANIDLSSSQSYEQQIASLTNSWSSPVSVVSNGFSAPNSFLQSQQADMQGLIIEDKATYIKLKDGGRIVDSSLSGSLFQPGAFNNGHINRSDLSRTSFGLVRSADLSLSNLTGAKIFIGNTQDLNLNGATLTNARGFALDDDTTGNATTWGADTRGFWADTDGAPHGSSLQINNRTSRPYIVTTTSDQLGVNFRVLLEGDSVNVSGYSSDPIKFLLNSVVGEWLEWNLVETVDVLTALGFVEPEIDAAVNYIYDYLLDDARQVYTQFTADVNTYVWDFEEMIAKLSEGSLEGFIPSGVGADNQALGSHYIY